MAVALPVWEAVGQCCFCLFYNVLVKVTLRRMA